MKNKHKECLLFQKSSVKPVRCLEYTITVLCSWSARSLVHEGHPGVVFLFQWYHRGGPGGGWSPRPRPQTDPAGEPEAAAEITSLCQTISKPPGATKARAEQNSVGTRLRIPDCAFREELHSVCTFSETLAEPSACPSPFCTVCVLLSGRGLI